MIVEIVDDEVDIGIVEDIIEAFDAHLMVRGGAGLAPDHGVIVVKVIRDGEQGTIRSKNAIALERLEVRKAGHKLVEEEMECVRKDLLTANNESALGGDGRVVAQLLRELTEDSAVSEAENGLDHLREAESAVAREIRIGVDAEEGTYLIQGLNGLSERVTNLIGPCGIDRDRSRVNGQMGRNRRNRHNVSLLEVMWQNRHLQQGHFDSRYKARIKMPHIYVHLSSSLQ